MKSFTDKVAMITGAGSGIGQALAINLAKRGCHLAITDIHADRLEATADAVRAAGRRVSVHGFDVSKREAWPTVAQEVLDAHGAVHLLVNNAGVSLAGPFTSCSLDDLEWQINVNMWGVIYGCHFMLPHLLEQRDAHLVNVSSIFGIVSMPDNTAYCMSKHAVRSLSEALEMELHEADITISSVHPGAVATRIAEDGTVREGGFFDQGRVRRTIAKGMSPEEAASIIAKGIAKNQARILVGKDAGFMARLHQFMPVGYRKVLMRQFRKAAERRAARARG